MEPVISFQVIETGDPERLIVHDFSDWGVDPNIYSVIIEITLPGAITPRTNTYDKNSYNAYDSINLQDNTVRVALPDGVYNLKVVATSDVTTEQENKYLKTDSLELAIAKLYLREYNKCSACSPVIELREARYCLESAKELIKIGQIDKATATFEAVTLVVNKLTECKDCK
tara:strand:- start:3389 stop:3901 length:513 start_codon:yes stop_codon:yes gene_type:complete